MGCDIHIYAERYRTMFGVQPDRWEKVGPSPTLDWTELIDPADIQEMRRDLSVEQIEDILKSTIDLAWDRSDDNLIRDRNYMWFAFLANVRNYSNCPFISSPRGLPSDLSDGLGNVIRFWDEIRPGDAHSHSWLLVQELIEYDYSRRFTSKRSFDSRPDGTETSLCEFLGPRFFSHLETFRSLGDPWHTRLVFFLDN
jgi:hypothetical protein